jgi:thiamine biosynthesis lipoprotein
MRVLLLLFAMVLPAHAEIVPIEQRSQWVMGTELRIVIVGDDAPALLDECFAIAHGAERVLSRWDPQAELARLNAAAGAETEVSAELFAWLERCARDHRRTGGAFDPTVGTWILDPESRMEIGMGRVELGPGRHVRLPAGFALDSGGDGKGVAVDLIVARLREAGVEALVSFGGSSIYGLGAGPGEGWTLGVADVEGNVLGTVRLEDAGLSVSHSIQIDHLADGRNEHRPHIYDPATGELVTEARTAVVWSTSATEAEVLSTALIVRGDLGLLEEFPGARAVISPREGPLPDWIRRD